MSQPTRSPSTQIIVLDTDAGRRQSVAAQVQAVRDDPVYEAAHVTEAVELAGAASNTVILATVDNPIDVGLATLCGLRDALPQVGVIACSARSDSATLRRIIQSGARDLLPLPLVDEDLRAALDAHLNDTVNAGDNGAGSLGTVLTVIGAKGGVGKTTIATNLAAAIAHDTERSVLLVDLDTRFGDLAVLLDLEPRYSVVDLALVADAGLTTEIFQRALTPHDSGAFILAAPHHPAAWSQVSPQQLQAILRFSRQLFDFIIFDTPGAFTDLVAAAIEEADRILLTSSLELTSIKDTRYVLDLLEADGTPSDRIHLILNQVHARTTLSPEETAALVERPSFAQIPYDDRVIEANSLGSPVVLAYPSSRAAREFRRIAAAIDPRDSDALTPKTGALRSLVWNVVRRFRRAA
ncbi:MAG: AAA family ATPase [Chloroflexi bacterium]|nr:AAA family ATPase [Chloroflexota bacterium]